MQQLLEGVGSGKGGSGVPSVIGGNKRYKNGQFSVGIVKKKQEQ